MTQNPNCVSIRFYRKMTVYGKNWLKLYISWLWSMDSELVIHNGQVYTFLWVIETFKIRLKIKSDSLRYYRKTSICDKNWSKLCISLLLCPYSGLVIHNCPLDKFLWILNFLNFGSKFKGASLRFYLKMCVCDKNWPKLRISWSWSLYSWSDIHNSHLDKFLHILIFSILAQNPKVLAFAFTEKCLFAVKSNWNSIFLDLEDHIPYHL
jgi:hypothetical protein